MSHRSVTPNKGLFTACLLACLAATAGCEGKLSTLLTRHFSNDQKDQAKERWEHVRSEVKLQIAEQHLKSGRLPEAEKALEQALALKSDGPRLYVLLTKLRLEQGRLSDARQAVEQAANFAPSDPEVLYLTGIIEERYGNMEAALSQYTTAVADAPDCVDFVMAQAEAMVSLGRLIDALELIESRVADFDGHAPIHVLAAKVNLMLGLRSPAVEHARQAIGLAPDDAMLAADAGWILVWAGECREAIGVLEPLVGDSRTDAPKQGAAGPKPKSTPHSLRHTLAKAYLSCGQTRDAQHVLKPLLNDRERDGLAWMLYARAALTSGDLELASQSLGMARRFDMESAETWLLTASVALQMKDYPASRDAALKSLEIDPDDQTAYWLRGLAERALGLDKEARDAFRKASQLDGNSAISAGLLATLPDEPGSLSQVFPVTADNSEGECVTP